MRFIAEGDTHEYADVISEFDGTLLGNPAADQMNAADVEAKCELALTETGLVRSVTRGVLPPEVIGLIATHALALLDMGICSVMYPNQDWLMDAGATVQSAKVQSATVQSVTESR